MWYSTHYWITNICIIFYYHRCVRSKNYSCNFIKYFQKFSKRVFQKNNLLLTQKFNFFWIDGNFNSHFLFSQTAGEGKLGEVASSGNGETLVIRRVRKGFWTLACARDFSHPKETTNSKKMIFLTQRRPQIVKKKFLTQRRPQIVKKENFSHKKETTNSEKRWFFSPKGDHK